MVSLSATVLLLGGCTPGKNNPSNEKPDLSTPEGLVDAVFQALKNHDAEAYVMLTANTREELQIAFENNELEPSDAQLEEIRQHRKNFFNEFVVMVEQRGIHLAKSTIKESRHLQGGAARFENLVLVVQDGETELEILLDDCLLFPRGWLIVDCLRLNE